MKASSSMDIFHHFFGQTMQYLIFGGGVIGGVIVFTVLFMWIAKRISWQVQKVRNRHGVLLEICLPKQRHSSDVPNQKVSQEKTKSSVAEQMFAELHSLAHRGLKKYFLVKPVLSFEVVMTADTIRFYCFCQKQMSSFIKDAIYTSYPEANVQEVEPYVISKNAHTATGIVSIKGPEYAPIRTYETMVVDPLNALLNAVGTLQKDEIVTIQTLFSPVDESWRSRAYSFLNSMKQDILQGKDNQIKLMQQNVVDSFTGNDSSKKDQDVKVLDQTLYHDVEAKMSRPGFEVSIRIIASSLKSERAKSLLEDAGHAYSVFNNPPLAIFILHKAYFSLHEDFFLRMRPTFDSFLRRKHFLANTIELASLYHFPGEEIEAVHVNWLTSKRAPAPSDVPTSGTFLGVNTYRGVETKIYIKPEDRRRHMYIVGQTGTGKTEFLKNLILEDIAAGNGMCFIDPHGDAAEDILQKIPVSRIKDTIYWDPSDSDFPFGLNIMEAANDEEKNKIINAFIAMLYKMYDPNHVGIMGPLIERAIRNVMLTAMEDKNSTLVEVLRLLTSADYAKSKIPFIKDKLVKTYWTEELAHTTDFHKSETLGYFVSKFDRFVTDKLVRNIIGQSQSSFNFTDIMNNKKILIINLAKGKLGEENSQFLGLLLIPKILLAAMARTTMPEKNRSDFYLYVDEFQNFATSDFAEILSEARKYGLCLTVAHQYMSQLQEEIRNAVIGNVGTLCAFRVGADDGKYLLPQFEPVFNEYDLTNSSIGNVYTKLLINGKPSLPFSLQLPSESISAVKKDARVKELITRIAKVQYGMPKTFVEKEIADRAQLG